MKKQNKHKKTSKTVKTSRRKTARSDTGKKQRLCSQCRTKPVHYNLNVCYDCEYFN